MNPHPTSADLDTTLATRNSNPTWIRQPDWHGRVSAVACWGHYRLVIGRWTDPLHDEYWAWTVYRKHQPVACHHHPCHTAGQAMHAAENAAQRTAHSTDPEPACVGQRRQVQPHTYTDGQLIGGYTGLVTNVTYHDGTTTVQLTDTRHPAGHSPVWVRSHHTRPLAPQETHRDR